MDPEKLLAVILSIVIFSLSVILAICGSKSGNTAQVDVRIFPNQISGISPADFSIQVSIYSPSPIKSVKINLEDDEIFSREIKKEERIQDTELNENEYLIKITSGGKYVSISFTKQITFAGDIAKIFSFVAYAETEEKGKGMAKLDVIVYSNQPCSVRIYIASPQGNPIELPPFPVQLGADVNDDRCGNFNHLSGTNCKFKFIWDADNKGQEFVPDGETDQPSFNFTYQQLGIYTPKVVVIDDGGNTCESSNIEPVYVLRKFENFSFIPKEIFIPSIKIKYLDNITKIIVSKPDKIIEYDIGPDGRFNFKNIITTTSREIIIGDNFLALGSGSKVEIFPVSGSSINWRTSTEISRLFEKMDSISFQNKATFFIFFLRNQTFFCPYKPPDFQGDTGCLNVELGYDFSGIYGIYADQSEDKIYLAIYQKDTKFNVSIYSFNLKYDSAEKIWLVDTQNYKHTEIKIDYLPSKFTFFKDTKNYVLINTTDPSGGVGYRSYIFDILTCLSGNCSPISGTNINMPKVVEDIPDTEICALTDQQKSYKLNIINTVVGNNISLCGSGGICLVSSLCLDEVGGVKCRKLAYYPFLFQDDTVKKNLRTNCIISEIDAKEILSADQDNILISSGRFLFNGKISKNKIEVIDSESMNVEPTNISGFQSDNEIVISAAGKEGIDFMKFSNDGSFQGYDFHLFVKPEIQDIGQFSYDLVIHRDYSVIKHMYDGEKTIAILQRPGCGEDFNFSGIFVYDKPKSRKYRIYRRYNDIGIHSIAVSDIKKFSGKYLINMSGLRCQDPTSYLISLEMDDSFNLKERFRLNMQEPIIDILTYSDDLMYVSSSTRIFKIENGVIRKSIDGEGGGLIYAYRGYIFEFLSKGPYINIKIFDGELNKIKDQSIYFGLYPSISKVIMTKAIDEVFGTNQDIDIAILSLSSPVPQSRISIMIVFYLTDFLNSGKDIDILGIAPNFGVGTSDMKYFRGSKNLLFLVDSLSKGIFLGSLR